MENTTTPPAPTTWEFIDGTPAFWYGGCRHSLTNFGVYATATAIWACSGFPDGWGYKLVGTDMDFGGWTIHLYIQLPDGRVAKTD
jgi:hypothetical protein